MQNRNDLIIKTIFTLNATIIYVYMWSYVYICVCVTFSWVLIDSFNISFPVISLHKAYAKHYRSH